MNQDKGTTEVFTYLSLRPAANAPNRANPKGAAGGAVGRGGGPPGRKLPRFEDSLDSTSRSGSLPPFPSLTLCLTTQLSENSAGLPPRHCAGGARPYRRLCVSSEGPIGTIHAEHQWPPSGSRAPPRGGAEADFHGAQHLDI
jgi:hypothetical protein